METLVLFVLRTLKQSYKWWLSYHFNNKGSLETIQDFGWTMTLSGEKILISNRCISGLMSNLIKKSWTDSNLDCGCTMLQTNFINCLWRTKKYLQQHLILFFMSIWGEDCKNIQEIKTLWWFLSCLQSSSSLEAFVCNQLSISNCWN